MKQTWEDYERAAEKGPLSLALKVIFGLVLVGAVISGISFGFGLIGETAKVARDEFGPKAALAKYEWFKDVAAQLDQKLATIEVYKTRVKNAETRANKYPSDTNQEAVTQAETELDGLIASYNNLASSYNSEMSKVNWRFANVGELPPGADKPLPREYKPYIKE